MPVRTTYLETEERETWAWSILMRTEWDIPFVFEVREYFVLDGKVWISGYERRPQELRCGNFLTIRQFYFQNPFLR